MASYTSYVFVTGGVVSSLGKGIAAASLGMLLKSRGYRVGMLKLDPYLNIDPGTMSPTQHGEVFVTVDGAETDLDLGHYERFTDFTATKRNNVTSGQIYKRVLEKEREGGYLGHTVQVIPHITNEIKGRILNAAGDNDILIVEVGGTVGDIESLPFMESIRQLKADLEEAQTVYIHLTLVPYISAAGELKTKPTQNSVKQLQALGIAPDIIICRCDRPLPDAIKSKIARFCGVSQEDVITAQDASSIYEVPLFLKEEYLDVAVLEYLQLEEREASTERWVELVGNIRNPERTIEIGIVGKYDNYTESYKSILESLIHAGAAHKVKVVARQASSDTSSWGGYEGLLVPGGFGIRGSEEKIAAITYARTEKVPFLGICLGMQLAVIEYLRNVCGMVDATSQEFQLDAVDPAIALLEEQKSISNLGGTMRLGSYDCSIVQGYDSIASRAYHTSQISERHRHRYEVNPLYVDLLEECGMFISGRNERLNLAEIVEIPDHPWFLACQFHPEFKSRPLTPHPLFYSFIEAVLEQ